VTFKSDEYRINNGVRFTYQATGKLEEMSRKSTITKESTVLFVDSMQQKAIQGSARPT